MTLQEQLRKLTTGGPGVTHIASETLFEDCARELDFYHHLVESWKREERDWYRERERLVALLIEAEGLLCDPQGGPCSVEMAAKIRSGLGINTEAK